MAPYLWYAHLHGLCRCLVSTARRLLPCPTRRQRLRLPIGSDVGEAMERAKGFEPSTPTLARLCSTPELRPRIPCCLWFMVWTPFCRASWFPALDRFHPDRSGRSFVPS